MLHIKKTQFIIIMAIATCILLIVGGPLWAKQNTQMNLNLTPDQIKTLETVVNDLSEKQFKIASDIERTLLELKFEIQREDRFATDSKAAESARRANKLIKKLTALHGDMLKLEVAYVLKAKDVLTKEQRGQLIESLDFDMEAPDGWMQNQEIEVLAVDLELSDDQLKKILSYRTQMQKKETKIEQKTEALLQDLERELIKDAVDDKKVNKIILSLTDLGLDLLNNRVEHRLKAKDVLTVAQKKKLLHAMFIASGF
jgi:Spy/CpxP family protein refolding chaperone